MDNGGIQRVIKDKLKVSERARYEVAASSYGIDNEANLREFGF
jgi:hypothetical protein